VRLRLAIVGEEDAGLHAHSTSGRTGLVPNCRSNNGAADPYSLAIQRRPVVDQKTHTDWLFGNTRKRQICNVGGWGIRMNLG